MDLKKQAKQNFKTLCEYLESRNYKYRIEDDNIVFSFLGQDLNIELRFSIDEKRTLINLYSPLPFKIPAKSRKDMAIAVCAINWMLGDGSFDYDYINGSLCFRLTSVYRDSIISKNAFEYMLRLGTSTVERYNDKFFYISQGKMSLNDLAKYMMGE